MFRVLLLASGRRLPEKKAKAVRFVGPKIRGILPYVHGN